MATSIGSSWGGVGTVAIDDEDDSGVEFDNHFGARML